MAPHIQYSEKRDNKGREPGTGIIPESGNQEKRERTQLHDREPTRRKCAGGEDETYRDAVRWLTLYGQAPTNNRQ
ncbi:hypothetical protein KSB_00330 [Ktedonobacter robiniae]|uniref:Uncharacterized protein n=1 Tax=Ktedonobacter robiniae TaxID=2778365 RepID=A0ABQ3UFR9_9CHLR|nr:hypothetical protein KSB_00330 [Ktedonobacter robiniae]